MLVEKITTYLKLYLFYMNVFVNYSVQTEYTSHTPRNHNI